jgi:sugar phosphate isomerase/epimerase
MTRRTLLASALAASATAAPQTTMGVATTSYMTGWRPKDTLEFLERCRQLGAGGIQASLSSLEPAYIKQLRDKAGQYGMYIELMGGLPRGDSAAFEATLKASKEVGALCVRSACLGGRRYETFKTLADWNAFVADSKAAVERGVRIAEKHNVRWALENHKDWTTEEFVELLRQYPSDYLGVCVDTGNNLSLLDEPMELVEALAPRAFSTHIKDMGVQPYPDGFLLSEVPFGDGFLDLKRMISILKKHQPGIRLTLEMITRNPLKVPCLTDAYWVPFPARHGRFLARTLRRVHAHASAKPLPSIEGKGPEALLSYEEDNVRRCLDFAKTQLSLA